MFFIFRNLVKRYRFNQSAKQGYKLLEQGEKEEAFKVFYSLLDDQPFNPYLRNKILMLGQELNKKVHLPSVQTKTKYRP